MLAEISEQVERSIENIGRAAQGQPISRSQSALPVDTDVVIQNYSGQYVTLKLGELLNQLLTKYRSTKTSKYNDAIKDLTTMSEVTEAGRILAKHGVIIKDKKLLVDAELKNIENKRVDLPIIQIANDAAFRLKLVDDIVQKVAVRNAVLDVN